MTLWFTSDTHYGHKNVIEYSARPYSDVGEMDAAMIKNWNDVVRDDDTIYHLGDFSFHKPSRTYDILRELRGKKYLVFGNHDKLFRKKAEFMGHWVEVHKFGTEIKVDDQRIVLCHYAMLTWNQSHRGAWMLHGHSHGTLPESQTARRIDVGVDPREYRPISFDEVREIMASKQNVPVDHHSERE